MTEGQMLYLILVIVAFLIFVGTLMRAMLITSNAKPAGSRDESERDRASRQTHPAH